MDFNDRRPRTAMRMRGKDVQSGDHVELAGVKYNVHSAAPGTEFDGRKGNMISASSPAHQGPGAPSIHLPNDSRRYVVHRLNLPTEYGAEEPKPMGDNGGAEVRYNDAAGRRTNPLR